MAVSIADPVMGWAAQLRPIMQKLFDGANFMGPNADTPESRRSLTVAEIDLLISAWGCNAVWAIPLHVYEGEARVEFDTDDVKGTLKMYWPAGASDATKVHEAGHAVHLALYPESVHWPTLKCETFAMLGVVRLKLDGAYGPRPEIIAAAGLLKREPARYDLVMKLAAEDVRPKD